LGNATPDADRLILGETRPPSPKEAPDVRLPPRPRWPGAFYIWGLFGWMHEAQPVLRDPRGLIGSMHDRLGLDPRMKKGPNRLHERECGFWLHGGMHAPVI
jgi:hypothetical protein